MAISTRRYSIFVSFIEIYNNYIYDLLEQPESGTVHWRRTAHKLRHDPRNAVYVNGASELEAKDADQAMQYFLFGLQNRQTAATRLNASSSRSHSIFTLKLVSYEVPNTAQTGPDLLQVSQLSIVDLAGVERAQRTLATGAKLAEASNINNSLLTLRNCFEALRHNQTAKQSQPIPYRTHKLTFLLKSFFEQGRAHIQMIVCVKPSVEELDDNVQVLSFGQKAQQIVIDQQPLSTNKPIDDIGDCNDVLGDANGLDLASKLSLTRLGSEDHLIQLGPSRFISEMELFLKAHEKESIDIGRHFNDTRKSLTHKLLKIT